MRAAQRDSQYERIGEHANALLTALHALLRQHLKDRFELCPRPLWRDINMALERATEWVLARGCVPALCTWHMRCCMRSASEQLRLTASRQARVQMSCAVHSPAASQLQGQLSRLKLKWLALPAAAA